MHVLRKEVPYLLPFCQEQFARGFDSNVEPGQQRMERSEGVGGVYTQQDVETYSCPLARWMDGMDIARSTAVAYECMKTGTTGRRKERTWVALRFIALVGIWTKKVLQQAALSPLKASKIRPSSSSSGAMVGSRPHHSF